jgi:hypothetical protein
MTLGQIQSWFAVQILTGYILLKWGQIEKGEMKMLNRVGDVLY